MKAHRSTQLFLNCSGGERNVKCVRSALQIETNKEEQRGAVCFLVDEGARTREIHGRMSAVHDERCTMFLISVHEWLKRFREGRTSLKDDSRPGQAHRAITLNVIARIDGLIRENHRITEKQIHVQVGRGSARVGEVVDPSATYLFLHTSKLSKEQLKNGKYFS